METLETERLVLRPLAMDDLEALHAILDLDLKWSGEPLPLEQRKELLQDYLKYAELNAPFGRRAIVLRENDRLIGMLIFRTGWVDPSIRSLFSESPRELDDPYQTLEVFVGYALCRAYWRKGYATEAVKALIHYAFTELKVRFVYVETDYENIRSMALMRRIGMRPERNHASDWQVVGRLENNLLAEHRAESS